MKQLPEQVVPAEVVERARDGDQTAFASIYDVMAPRLLRHARRRLGRTDLAEAVVQETMARALLEIGRTAPDLHVKSWLYRITANLIHDEYRDRREVSLEERHEWATHTDEEDGDMPSFDPSDLGRPLMMGESELDPAVLVEQSDEQERLRQQLAMVMAELAQAPNGARLTAVLVQQAEGATYEQIAVQLGVDVVRVKVLAERARLTARRIFAALRTSDDAI